MKSGKKLVIEVLIMQNSYKVIEATVLPVGTKYLITPSGSVKGMRKAKDGNTYFGSEQIAGETVRDALSKIGPYSL